MSRSFYAKLHRRYRRKRISGEERHRIAHAKREQFTSTLPPYLELFPWKIIPPKSIPIKNRVLIVGGGFAGLTAAWCLSKCGVEVRLFEARARFGGRVHSLKRFTPGRIIEAGAELIGLNHPAWLMFAQQFRLGMSVVTPEDDYRATRLEMPMRINGKHVESSKAEALYEEMTDAFKTLLPYVNKIRSAYLPWVGRRAHDYDQQSVGGWIEGLRKRGFSRLLRAALDTQLSNTNATSTANQSFLGLLALMKGGELPEDPLGFWSLSEVFRCEDGNQALAECLAADVLEEQSRALRRKSPIRRITIEKDRVLCESDSEKFYGDCVIFAVPPSVWKSIEIIPPIPQGRCMTLGPAIKHLSNVRSRFWIRDGALALAPSGASDTLGLTWEGTDGQIGGTGFELTVFSGGESAVRALRSGGSAAYFAKEIAKLYPGYSNAVLRQRFIAWPEIPYTMGGYSCPAPGQVTTIGRFLSLPFSRRLFFAGEHTCMPFYGYMEGALQSGLHAAVRVLESKW
ncbi:MAG: hypothetical protein C5B50_05680 [Verrucomicrobia bacterium]|nr:MAG: hypothetical protein C5B50_05680 [Verrucomicrobiota bacterium]